MSKLQKCAGQVHENKAIERLALWQVLEYVRLILQRNVFICCVTTLVACGQHNAENHPNSQAVDSANPKIGRKLSRGLPGEPQTLDPQLADDTFSLQVIRDLFEGLTAENRMGKIVAGTASSWSLDSSGTLYTFHLRENAKWSNGDRISAFDFVEGLRRAVDPRVASGSAALLSVIKGAKEVIAGTKPLTSLAVRSIDNDSVEILLEHPAPYFLEILSQPISFPVHTNFTKTSIPVKDGIAGMITNGPYTLASRHPGATIDLEKNLLYWDAANVAIERVRYVNVESEATEEREYAANQLDLTFTVPATDLTRATEIYKTQLQSAPVLATLYLALDLLKPPMRNNRNLRQALSMAVDRDQIAKYVIPGVTPAYAYVSNGVNGYLSPEYPWATWSRSEQLKVARKLFRDAGYSPNNKLKLKIYFNRDEGIQRLMAAIAGSWKQNLGIQSELVSDEFRVFLAGRRDRSRWDVARLGWTADYNDPSSFLDVFAQTNSQNDPGYVSNAFNTSMAKAEVEISTQKRTESLREAERILLDDYPIIPIYFYNARRLVKPYVGGAGITSMNRTYSKFLYWNDQQQILH